MYQRYRRQTALCILRWTLMNLPLWNFIDHTSHISECVNFLCFSHVLNACHCDFVRAFVQLLDLNSHSQLPDTCAHFARKWRRRKKRRHSPCHLTVRVSVYSFSAVMCHLKWPCLFFLCALTTIRLEFFFFDFRWFDFRRQQGNQQSTNAPCNLQSGLLC